MLSKTVLSHWHMKKIYIQKNNVKCELARETDNANCMN